ncbi:MAG: hypothetical protein WBB85_04580 [Albidovulum sp.]|uniref:hypothetical protein n=1 Tax=Albidovulum sp. TaxID=1872424 RepID=UPI003CBE7F82
MTARKTLVMWSGGLDSTYGLVRLLRESDDEVYAHHISRYARDDTGQSMTQTANYEDRAVHAMRPIVEKAYRPFTFTQSAVNLLAFRNFARDTSTAMFFAAHAAMSHDFSGQDRILLSMNSDEDKSWNPGSELYDFLRAATIRVLRVTWGGDGHPRCFLWDHPPAKRDEAAYLPEQLVTLTASCRNPHHDQASNTFGRCQACPECVSLSAIAPKRKLKLA